MSEAQLKTLAKIIRDGWMAIANDEGDDRESMVDITKTILESLEQFEAKSTLE